MTVRLREVRDEVLAAAGAFAAVGVGSLLFVTLMMPFVFPLAVGAAVMQRRRARALLRAWR